MTDLVIDAAMFILLSLSVVFAGIGVIGLLVFPEIRSRMYTATRAPVISISAMTGAVIVYALSMILSGGGDPYLVLIIHVLVLLFIIAGANVLLYRIIMRRIKRTSFCQVSPQQKEERE